MFNNFLNNFSSSIRGLMFGLFGGSLVLSGYLYFFQDGNKKIIVIALVAVILIAVTIILYFCFRKLAKDFRGKLGTERLLKMLSRSPKISADQQSKLESLRTKFMEGIREFQSRGMKLYSFPWYMTIGEAGAGKTEAIRNSNIGFSQGLQDPFQGTGGTMNMSWWFANDAIILDTAGRIVEEKIEVDSSSEWITLLKFLKKYRPHEAINGVFLVISAESLINYSTNLIKEKASLLSRRLHEIQSNLDLRFPVYIIISKCDKIVGFREFFADIGDLDIQHQIVGWSNPSALDDPYNPEKVDEYVNDVVQRFYLKRRGLLKAENGITNASLFAFPSELSAITPRLKLYLEQIFPSGRQREHSFSKHLFVRGIYFTSSMQEGSVLDKAVTEMLGLDLSKLSPELKDYKQDISLFLHDLFKLKAFQECGLITRFSNLKKKVLYQKIAVTLAAVIALFFLIFQTWRQGDELKKSVGESHASWTQTKDQFLEQPKNLWTKSNLSLGQEYWRPIVRPEFLDAKKYHYDRYDALQIKNGINTTSYNTIDFLHILKDQPQYIKVPKIFRFFNKGEYRDFRTEMTQAYKILCEYSLLLPLIDSAKQVFVQNLPDPEFEWTNHHTTTLKTLLRLESEGSDSISSNIPLPLESFFSVILKGEEYQKFSQEKSKIMAIYNAAFPDNSWTAQYAFASQSLEERIDIKNALVAFTDSCLNLESIKTLKDQRDKIKKLNDQSESPSSEEANISLVALTKQMDELIDYEQNNLLLGVMDRLEEINTSEKFDDLSWEERFRNFEEIFQEFNKSIALAQNSYNQSETLRSGIQSDFEKLLGSMEALSLSEAYTKANESVNAEFIQCFESLPVPDSENKLVTDAKSYLKGRKLGFQKTFFDDSEISPSLVAEIEGQDSVFREKFEALGRQRESLQKRFQGYNTIINQFIKFYGYWEKRTNIQSASEQLSWSELHTELNSLQVHDVHDYMENFCLSLKKNIEEINEEFRINIQGELEAKGHKIGSVILDRIQKTRDSTGNNFKDTCQRFLDNCKGLEGNANQARLKFLSMNIKDLSREYFPLYIENPETFNQILWRNLTVLSLKTIAADAEFEIKLILEKFKQECKFPLVKPDEFNTELSLSQFNQIIGYLDNIFGPNFNDNLHSKPYKLESEFREINTQLSRLSDLSFLQNDREGLSITYEIIELLQKNRFNILMVNTDEQKKLDNSGILIWRGVSINGKERIRTQQPKDEKIDKFQLPGEQLIFEFFRHPGDDKPDRIVTVDSIWTGIRLLHKESSQSDRSQFRWETITRSDDGKVWTIAIFLMDSQKERQILFRLNFEMPLPDLAKWPVWK